MNMLLIVIKEQYELVKIYSNKKLFLFILKKDKFY